MLFLFLLRPTMMKGKFQIEFKKKNVDVALFTFNFYFIFKNSVQVVTPFNMTNIRRRRNNNDNIIGQVVTPGLSMSRREIDFSNSSSVLDFITSSSSILSNDPNISNRVQQLDSNTSEYVNSVNASVWRFFHLLSQHETLSPLTESLEDPAAPSQAEHQIIILTRGKKNQDKYKILNTALTFIAMHTKNRT